jgi:DNA modification methylase
MNQINLYNGDCLEILKTLPENSIDSIVTDPPYGLSFMGKKWDYQVPSIEIWKECFRVLKHGGHLLSFGGTRTYHRLVVNIEDAGFEIRDCIQWLYGSGFPKSTDVSKRIDKEAGAERPLVKRVYLDGSTRKKDCEEGWKNSSPNSMTRENKPISDSAKQWQGWGTALKPANEPICVARKPLEKGLTVAENVQKWGCGALNIDTSRIELGSGKRGDPRKADGTVMRTNANTYGEHKDSLGFDLTQGRWPANIILDEEAAAALDEQSGQFKGEIGRPNRKSAGQYNASNFKMGVVTETGLKDFGGASRFFYVAKASKSERNKGLEGMPLVESGIKNDSGRGFSESDPHKKILNQNFHPTVKPIKLMQYLIKLVTPPNGTVLDPFMGSGSTGVAAKSLGFNFAGCEMSADYFQIAKNRIQSHEPQDK